MAEAELTSINGDAQAIIDVAQKATAPHPIEQGIESVQRVAIPNDMTLVTIDHEPYDQFPRRKKGTVELGTVEALAAYVERHAEDSTTVWVHPKQARIEAVIDDHEPHIILVDEVGEGDEPSALNEKRGFAGHGEHRAVLNLIHTPQWLHWLKLDGQLVTQVKFAEHIEDGLLEIDTPAPTVMMELAQTFHAKQGITFKSANRIKDGQSQFQYDEETSATAGKSGQLEIPNEFTLLVQPYLGEATYKLNARLRYRITKGELQIGYKIDRPEVILIDARDKIADRLAERFPGAVFIGTPRGHNTDF